jgi:serine/threonine protein kinase/Flp pilus assembly protein TadD
MSAQPENGIVCCEQCGAPLQSRDGENECLNCLLTAGLQSGQPEANFGPNEPGQWFYQHYEILSRPDGTRWELGHGAMGVTYKARDINLDSPVALKIINARVSSQPGARQRFLHEAQAAARLRHPNVATVFHFGAINTLPAAGDAGASPEEQAEAGDCFYAMEFIEGENLEARLRRCGPVPPQAALEIGVQVARALAAAEKRGLVHRDLKPSNIMLAEESEPTPTGRTPRNDGEAWVKVIDFGVARLADKTEQTAGKFFGTLAFASPEQVQLRPVDVRSDIYSLGVTLWYSLCGRLPYPSRTPEDFRPELRRAPLPVAQLVERKVPPRLVALLQSALAYDPNDRPASAADFAQALQICLDDLAGSRSPVPRLAQNRASRWAMAGGGLGMAAGLIALLLFFSSAGPPMQDKSIAVLPFRNLTGNPANAFFAEGIEDDILARLVKIRDLKVISHLSSARYPAEHRRDLSAIGRSLGVRHVLEGSFDRTADHILLRVRLVDTSDGHELWTEKYDRPVADVVNLQGELASAIAGALDATVSPQESLDLRAKSTGNPDAYVLFLRGRKFDNTPGYAIADNEAAQALYSQAIALDPGFALAHARRGAVLAFLYRFRGPDEDLKKEAHAEIREALRLQPDLGEAHLAKGLCLYRIDRNFDGALKELEIAKRLLPNDTEGESFVAYIHRRRGQWKEARAILMHVLERDPRNVTYAEELYTTGYILRDWAAAEKYARLAEVIAPNEEILRAQRALVEMWRNGNLEPLKEVFAGTKSYGGAEGTLTWMRWNAAMLSRDFAAAEEAIDRFPFDTLTSVFSAPVPKSYLRGCVALAQGKNKEAQDLFESARPVMEAEALAHPDNELRHARLGLLYAHIDRRADAIREGKRAIELKPLAEDADGGVEQLANLALIYARVGENDQAIEMIQKLLQTPGAVFFSEASISWWELRLSWEWDPMRNDPRFQKILAEPEPATVF